MSNDKELDETTKLHKKLVIITNNHGKSLKYSIKSIIPMHKWNEEKTLNIEDVEILLCKKRNHYFSVNSFLLGRSWVRSIEITSKNDNRIKSKNPIVKHKQKQMETLHFRQVNNKLMELVMSNKVKYENEQ